MVDANSARENIDVKQSVVLAHDMGKVLRANTNTRTPNAAMR